LTGKGWFAILPGPRTDARQSRSTGEQGCSLAGAFFPLASADMTPAEPAPSPHLPCSPQRVLIVDRSCESREVLRFALERRGVEVLEAEQAEAGLDLLRDQRPQIVVLDLEVAGEDEQTTFDKFDRAAESHAGRMILGKLGMPGDGSRIRAFVNKPYHFAPLVHKIEELLAGR
jgi:CheY-like chemotaxis protein